MIHWPLAVMYCCAVFVSEFPCWRVTRLWVLSEVLSTCCYLLPTYSEAVPDLIQSSLISGQTSFLAWYHIYSVVLIQTPFSTYMFLVSRMVSCQVCANIGWKKQRGKFEERKKETKLGVSIWKNIKLETVNPTCTTVLGTLVQSFNQLYWFLFVCLFAYLLICLFLDVYCSIQQREMTLCQKLWQTLSEEGKFT